MENAESVRISFAEPENGFWASESDWIWKQLAAGLGHLF